MKAEEEEEDKDKDFWEGLFGDDKPADSSQPEAKDSAAIKEDVKEQADEMESDDEWGDWGTSISPATKSVSSTAPVPKEMKLEIGDIVKANFDGRGFFEAKVVRVGAHVATVQWTYDGSASDVARKNIRAKDAPDDVDEEKGAVPEKVFKEGQNVEANFREKGFYAAKITAVFNGSVRVKWDWDGKESDVSFADVRLKEPEEPASSGHRPDEGPSWKGLGPDSDKGKGRGKGKPKGGQFGGAFGKGQFPPLTIGKHPPMQPPAIMQGGGMLGALGQRHSGMIVFRSPAGFGKLRSSTLNDDVFVPNGVLGELAVGSEVTFSVTVGSQGRLQACQMLPVQQAQPLPSEEAFRSNQPKPPTRPLTGIPSDPAAKRPRMQGDSPQGRVGVPQPPRMQPPASMLHGGPPQALRPGSQARAQNDLLQRQAILQQQGAEGTQRQPMHNGAMKPGGGGRRACDPQEELQKLESYPRTLQQWADVQEQVWAGHPELPESWIRVWSRRKQRAYYVDVYTLTSTFDVPPEPEEEAPDDIGPGA